MAYNSTKQTRYGVVSSPCYARLPGTVPTVHEGRHALKVSMSCSKWQSWSISTPRTGLLPLLDLD